MNVRSEDVPIYGEISRSINFTAEIGLARACAQGLREAALKFTTVQAALRARLLQSADQLELVARLASRAIERIEILDGSLSECVREMEAWDLLEDRISTTRAALQRAHRALAGGAS